MSEVRIVLLRTCGVQLIRAARACTKFSVWCDGAEMNIFRRRTLAMVSSPVAVTYQEKRFFIIPTGDSVHDSVRHGSKRGYPSINTKFSIFRLRKPSLVN